MRSPGSPPQTQIHHEGFGRMLLINFGFVFGVAIIMTAHQGVQQGEVETQHRL
jgi:hypothetical protein